MTPPITVEYGETVVFLCGHRIPPSPQVWIPDLQNVARTLDTIRLTKNKKNSSFLFPYFSQIVLASASELLAKIGTQKDKTRR